MSAGQERFDLWAIGIRVATGVVVDYASSSVRCVVRLSVPDV